MEGITMAAADPPKTPHILHESDVRKVVSDVIEGSVGQTGESIADVDAPYTLNATFSNTEVKTAVDELGAAINSILAVLRINGLIAPPDIET